MKEVFYISRIDFILIWFKMPEREMCDMVNSRIIMLATEL
jgi:hypothetical protein